jgi:hypothetical protein
VAEKSQFYPIPAQPCWGGGRGCYLNDSEDLLYKNIILNYQQKHNGNGIFNENETKNLSRFFVRHF